MKKSVTVFKGKCYGNNSVTTPRFLERGWCYGVMKSTGEVPA
jgi:hypothetical protein